MEANPDLQMFGGGLVDPGAGVTPTAGAYTRSR